MEHQNAKKGRNISVCIKPNSVWNEINNYCIFSSFDCEIQFLLKIFIVQGIERKQFGWNSLFWYVPVDWVMVLVSPQFFFMISLVIYVACMYSYFLTSNIHLFQWRKKQQLDREHSAKYWQLHWFPGFVCTISSFTMLLL